MKYPKQQNRQTEIVNDGGKTFSRNSRMTQLLKSLIVGLMFCFLPGLAAVADSPCGPSSRNGPLSRLIPQEYHGADFRQACRAHDACYGLVGSDKAECDCHFYQELLCACENSRSPLRCKALVRGMYKATRIGGERAFRDAQNK